MTKLKQSPYKTSTNLPHTVDDKFLKQECLTQEQFLAMQEIVKLPNVKSIKDANKKAIIIKKLFELGNKLPQDNIKTIKFSKIDLNKSLKDIRETGGKVPFHEINLLLLIMLLFYLLSDIFTFFMQFLMSTVTQEIVYELRHDIDIKLSKLPLQYFDSHSNGEILSRMTNDVDTISTTLQQSLTQFIQSIFQFIGFIIMMILISPMLAI